METLCVAWEKNGMDNGNNPPQGVFNSDVYMSLYHDLDSFQSPWIHYALKGKNEKRCSGVFCELISNILLFKS